MKFFLADTSFPLKKQSSAGMGMKCVQWQLLQHSADIVRDPRQADWIFLSSVHPQTAIYARKFRGMKGKVIFGGPGALSPSYYLHFANYVCVGDSQKLVKSIINCQEIEPLDNVLTENKESVTVDENFPFQCPPIQQEDGSFSVWCGRGCKNNCYFCHTGWALTYKESPNHPENIAKGLLARGSKISYLSNDLLQHSFYAKLPHVAHGSYSVRFLRKNGLPPARLVRLGVEGVSSRLRTYVKKPISFDDLVKCTSWLNQNKKGVRWFLIAGLPTETSEDWTELKSAIMMWKKITPKGVLELSFTAWCPDPSTPLAIMPLNDDYYQNFVEFREWFFRGVGFSNRIKLYQPRKPESRLKMAVCSMDSNKQSLNSGGIWGGNSIVQYPFKNKVRKLGDNLFKKDK